MGERMPTSLVDATEPAPVRVVVDAVTVRTSGDDDEAIVEVDFTLRSSVALTAPIQPLPPTAVLTSDGVVVGVAAVTTVSAAVAVRLTPGRPLHGVSSVPVARSVLVGELEVTVVVGARDAGGGTADPVVHRSPPWRLRP